MAQRQSINQTKSAEGMINITLGIDGMCFLNKFAPFPPFFSNFWSKTIMLFIAVDWNAAIANGVPAEKVAQDAKSKENEAIERALVAEEIGNDREPRGNKRLGVWSSQQSILRADFCEWGSSHCTSQLILN